jgi:hypothetical protein
MSELTVVTFHTAPPAEIRYTYQNPPYREVIGFSSSGSDLWTPRAREGADYQSEEYHLDSDFAETLETFLERRFGNPDLAGNCHMAAAGMRGLVGWEDERTARKYAWTIWEEGLDADDPPGPKQLKDGQQGVYAKGSRLDHSVVGLGPDEHIQLNETISERYGRYISIVPAAYNHEYSLREPGVSFYISK